LGNSFGSLGDLFPETMVPCRIRGCKNVLRISGDEAMRNVAKGKSKQAERMCDECFARLHTLEDLEQPCSKSGCEGTWVWNRFQQLEYIAQERELIPPKGLCQACRNAAKNIPAQQLPCRLKGCSNTWTWTARNQVEAEGKAAPRRLCDECFSMLNSLQDRELPCRVRGCGRSQTWNRYQQLEYIRSGKSLDNPPQRMCNECFKQFNSLKNAEQPCKIHGCKNTWTYSAYEQLELQRTSPEGETAAVPSRMCKTCFDFFNNAKDLEQPCRIRGCKHSWTWTRSMQLFAKVRGQQRAPARLCELCNSTLKTLSDREEPCMVQGCSGSWLYKAEEQLKDQCQGKGTPQKRCALCQDFLSQHQPEELQCKQCGKNISWSVQEQLLCQLGTFNKPERCADCIGDEIAAMRSPEPEASASRPVIRIPNAGPWTEHSATRDWAPRMSSELIDRMERAAIRVVCIGDEMTLSAENEDESWPKLLEARLQAREASKRQVCVFNAGMTGTSTALGVKRFLRDIAPFTPHLVVFSFAFTDARFPLHSTELGNDELQKRLERLTKDFVAFDALLEEYELKALCWLPNPIFPNDAPDDQFDPERHRQWAYTQQLLFDSVLRLRRQNCQKAGLPFLDARSLFEINGTHSARKWMGSWFLHNHIGAQNIAAWIESEIQNKELLP
jgi:hypothetical protein